MKISRLYALCWLSDNYEAFNVIYEKDCSALANWFISNPDKYLTSNSGHAFRLDSLNTDGIWIFRELNGKYHSYSDERIRDCFFGNPPSYMEKGYMNFIPCNPGDFSGFMNFLTPLCRKWAEVSTAGEFDWLPYYLGPMNSKI